MLSWDTVAAQLLTLLLASLALLIALIKVGIGRLEARNRQNAAAAQVNLLRQEIETMREKSDIATRELVNEVMQRYMDENRELQERLRKNETARATLQAEMESLRQRLEDTEAQLQKRIGELETVIQEKDARIAELEKYVLSHN